ncbi:MAG: hypothetical protein KDC87_12535, partial [Planctomycetes bacterium]|nr:hypothetical protein [Planctomycetota bacterium]
HRHAALLRLRGVPVVRLHGTAVERGTAHGALLARQILDWFEFYLLEDRFRSARTYQQEFVPFLEHNFRWPVAMVQEVDAVLAGMKGSGVPLRVAALARDFNRTDLLAINAYVETRAMRSACTQFAVWGAQTAGTDVAGGLIAGRNMDGEVDLRKTTVMHTLVFAVEQRAPGKHRFASVMWPGFVGTLSGISEDGLYSMENASGSGRGPVENALVPISWTQRFILENVTASVTPDAIARLFDAHRSSGGGACGPGCIVFFAQPFRGQRAPAFVYEGDRFGGVMRLPGEVRPSAQTCLMASNHPLKYRAGTGVPVPSFSSRWRYEAGKNLLETWTRQRRPIGTTEMLRLLQSACHGTTEHSVIFRANQKTIDLAIDDLKADMWDAPYLAWQRFAFAELFRPK